MKTILVTGANRGIGKEICNQLLSLGHRVIGTTRRNASIDATGLQNHQEFTLLRGDISMDEEVELMKSDFPFDHLDVLINNAGILGDSRSLEEITIDELKAVLETNTYGALRMSQTFRELLEKSSDARIINVSSGMGSFHELSTGHAAYRLSKAFLNVVTLRMNSEGFGNAAVVSVCPGWVQTDMGGSGAPRAVQTGAAGIVDLATRPRLEGGRFYRDGEEIDW